MEQRFFQLHKYGRRGLDAPILNFMNLKNQDIFGKLSKILEINFFDF